MLLIVQSPEKHHGYKGSTTYLQKSVERSQNNSHGQIIWVNEVQCLCHGNEYLIIHASWNALHIRTSKSANTSAL